MSTLPARLAAALPFHRHTPRHPANNFALPFCSQTYRQRDGRPRHQRRQQRPLHVSSTSPAWPRLRPGNCPSCPLCLCDSFTVRICCVAATLCKRVLPPPRSRRSDPVDVTAITGCRHINSTRRRPLCRRCDNTELLSRASDDRPATATRNPLCCSTRFNLMIFLTSQSQSLHFPLGVQLVQILQCW